MAEPKKNKHSRYKDMRWKLSLMYQKRKELLIRKADFFTESSFSDDYRYAEMPLSFSNRRLTWDADREDFVLSPSFFVEIDDIDINDPCYVHAPCDYKIQPASKKLITLEPPITTLSDTFDVSRLKAIFLPMFALPFAKKHISGTK